MSPPRSRIARLGTLLFGFSERVGPRTYAIAGFSLAALKVGVDVAVLSAIVDQPWIFNYLMPIHAFLGLMRLDPSPGWIALMLWSVPFTWIGVSMSVRRAADAGLSPWLGFLFFVPYLNYVLFLLLCGLPSRADARWEQPAGQSTEPAPFGPMVAIVLFTGGLGLGLALFHSQVLERYGLALFMGVPFVTGALASYLANRPARRSLATTLLVALSSQLAIGAGMVVVAAEGFLCLMMALPIAFSVAILGALWGREIATRRSDSPRMAAVVLLALPALDGLAPPPRPIDGMVASRVEIAAPPEVVWRHVVSFSELPPPREWWFHLGIAYPMRARIEGRGVGAVRRCEFSTGAFVEPITAWDPPRRLAFDVTASPPSLEEWSPYRRVYAAHLENGFRSRRGEFRLVAVEGGGTRLEGRTWYRLDLHPSWYWGPFADAIVGSIHQRVLRHIRALAEEEARRVAVPVVGVRLDRSAGVP